jgi:hypothetical protein
MRLAVHVAHIVKIRIVLIIFVGGTHLCNWEDNTETDPKEIGCENLN